MHDLGETVPPDFYVWRLILIEVDRVDSKDIVGGFPGHLRVHRKIRLYRSHKTRCGLHRTRLQSGETPCPLASGLDFRWTQGSVRLGRRYARTPPQCRHPLHRNPLLSKRGSRSPSSFLLSGSEESPASTSTPVSERAPAPVTPQNAGTKAKLRDLFGPQEE